MTISVHVHFGTFLWYMVFSVHEVHFGTIHSAFREEDMYMDHFGTLPLLSTKLLLSGRKGTGFAVHFYYTQHTFQT